MGRNLRETAKKTITQNQTQNECHHYWVIEVANGPKSRGICRYCGEAKDFLNSVPDLNAQKRRASPLELPEIPAVELDEDSKS